MKLLSHSVAEKKREAGGWSRPRSQASPWDGPPSVGYWLRAGKNSRARRSKGKEGLFRGIHTPECGPSQEARGHGRNTLQVWAILEGKRLQGTGLSVFIGVGNFIG